MTNKKAGSIADRIDAPGFVLQAIRVFRLILIGVEIPLLSDASTDSNSSLNLSFNIRHSSFHKLVCWITFLNHCLQNILLRFCRHNPLQIGLEHHSASPIVIFCKGPGPISHVNLGDR